MSRSGVEDKKHNRTMTSAITRHTPIGAARDSYIPLAASTLSLIVFCLLLCPIAIYFGTSAFTLFHYLLHVVLFNIVPGTLLYCCLIKEWKLTDGLAVIGWTVGLSLEVTLYDIADQFGLIQYFPLYPAITIVICGLFLLRSSDHTTPPPQTRHLFFPPFIAIAAISLVFIAIEWFTVLIDDHWIAQASHANSILGGWPYQSSDGIPLLYNYLIHTHIASAGHSTGIGTLEMAARSVPFLLSILCLSAIYYFSINICKNKWIGILVIAQIFGMVGYQFIQRNFWGSAMPSAAVRVISTLAAFPIFLALVSETFSDGALIRRPRERRFDYGRCVLILLLAWSASGTRFPALAAYGAGLVLGIAWNYCRHKTVSWNLVIFAISVIIVSALSLVRFYGALSSHSATTFMEFVAGPAVSFDRLNYKFFRIVQATGLPFYVSGSVTFVLMMLGKGTFLTGGILWLVMKKEIFRDKLDVFWFGTFLCGSLIWCFTFAPGGSHGTFVHYAHFGLAFVGARGLCGFITRFEWSYSSLVVTTVTVLMALLHFGETGYCFAQRVREGIEYQQRRPSALEGGDYRVLIDYLKAHRMDGSSYLVAGDMEEAISLRLPAEMVGRQFGSRRVLQIMIGRSETPELVKRVGFLSALSNGTERELLDSEEFLRIKNRFAIREHLTIIIAEDKGFEKKVLSGDGWVHESGRFAVLQLP